MGTITLVQKYEIQIPKEYEEFTNEELLNKLNFIYDIYGRDIIGALDAEYDYEGTILEAINGENVYIEDNKVSDNGCDIWLNGQQIEGEN